MQTNNEVGQTIANQIGRSAFVMLGAKDILTIENGLQFKVRGSARVNSIRIILDASDTYTVTFYKLGRAYSVKVVHEVSDVYADSLHTVIETTTGLYTRL